MKRIALEDCSLSVQELIHMAETEPVVLTRQGTPVVGIIEVDEGDVEAWSLGSNPDFLAIMERFRERERREGGISLAEVRRQFDLPQDASGTLHAAEENNCE